ncbi:GINS complex subunit Sld5 [Schizosaccharomyces cryophilus OY26]|uniref:DNA replication complex GINS protein SLD5 n=1 Tax=Schizosaccharomyces cryophilus (strain OY26 / ATCC MYA-4695 / CBS 11777 / NBRC 106824 / NRRL Y48691) TaxID=653667 RepID=S9W1A4_SCHCR|nr:GINS complex subunit Sld5 [Schizosaccharomyces cryophilus OY26]EPY53798.1 GINS complex subunit Sld5 [Schizosaccharomyces cryophilus OY26]
MDWDVDELLAEPTTEVEQDYSALCTQWLNERMAPELLPFAEDVVSRVTERLRAQVETLQSSIGTANATGYRSVLIQVELERIKFVLRSYLRTRLSKIDDYGQYIQANPNVLLNLSSTERQYLLRHQQLLHRQYMASFLRELPIKMNKLDDTIGRTSMVAAPDMENSVFCYVNETVEENLRVAENEYVTLDRGDILLLKYSVIANYVRTGAVSLI